MASSRYWRLVGISTSSNGPLELSELRIFENGVLADAGATLSSTFAPTGGALADLRDGLTSGVVSWPYISYSVPGFALVWDFGAGAGVELPQFQLGSGNGKNTYLSDFILQFSTDGITWSRFGQAVGIPYPGDLVLTDLPTTAFLDNTDVSWSIVAEGVAGSNVFTDGSIRPKPVIVSGNAQLSDAQHKSYKTSGLLDGNGSFLSSSAHVDFSMGSGGFTLEGWFYCLAPNRPYPHLITLFDSSGNCEIRLFITASTGRLSLYIYHSGAYQVQLIGANTVPLNAWCHIAAVRNGDAHYLFLNGILDATIVKTHTAPAASWAAYIGHVGIVSPDYFFRGHFEEVVVTKGEGKYVANFTPVVVAMQKAAHSFPLQHLSATPERMLPATELPDTTAQGHAREHAFFDAYNGGIGTITGTVKEKNTPANTPLRRRVILIDEASRMTIRETWSDPVTGAFEFRGVKQGVKYSTISYDHLHNYRAVIADNQDAA